MKKSFLAGIIVIAGVVILGCTSAGDKVMASPFDTSTVSNADNTSNIEISTNIKNKSGTINLINQTNLSRLQEQYLIELEQTLKKSNQILKANGSSISDMDNSAGNAYKLWDSQMNELYNSILQNLSVAEASELKANQDIWLDYKKNTILATAKETDSVAPLLENNENIYLTQERCYYLFFYYLNNNDNDFNITGLNGNINEDSNEKSQISTYLNDFNNNLKQSSREILSARGNDQLLQAYNNVSDIWSKELNDIYANMMLNASKYKDIPQYDKKALQGPESEWIDYKNEAIKNAQHSYKNSSVGQIEAKKTEIALIQARIFYLLNNNGEFL